MTSSIVCHLFNDITFHYSTVSHSHNKEYLSYFELLKKKMNTLNQVVYAWGSNSFGQLGIQHNQDGNQDKSIKQPTEINFLQTKHIKSIIPSSRHTLVIVQLAYASRLQLLGFGDNTYGQLGLGNNKSVLNPQIIKLPENEEVKKVAQGYANHSLIISHNLKVYSTGNNYCGQLGLNDEEDRNTFTEISFFQNKDTNKVFIGSFFSFLSTIDGSVYSWGDNNFGQLGCGNTTKQLKPIKLTHLKNIVKIALGSKHALSINNINKLHVWGSNSDGQLGLQDSIKYRTLPFQLPLFRYTQVQDIAAGGNFSLVLTKNGVLYAFGDNKYGQLGLGDIENRFNPTPVKNIFGRIKLIKAGFGYSMVLVDSKNIYTCGILASSGKALQEVSPMSQLVWNFSHSYIKEITSGREHSFVLYSRKRD